MWTDLVINAMTDSDRLQEFELKYKTMENDRDAEKQMKATARAQRDRMTKKYGAAIALLKSIKGINDHTKWLEVQAFLEHE